MEIFPRNLPFLRRIHRSTVNSPHTGQWRGALMFSLICAWIDDWANNRDAGDLIHHCALYDVTVMIDIFWCLTSLSKILISQKRKWTRAWVLKICGRMSKWQNGSFKYNHQANGQPFITKNSWYVCVWWNFNATIIQMVLGISLDPWWRHQMELFPRYWPFLRGHQICAWINVWVNNRKAGDLRRHRSHYDVSVMLQRQQANIQKLMNGFIDVHMCHWVDKNWRRYDNLVCVVSPRR